MNFLDDDDDDNSNTSYPTSIPIHVTSIDSRTGAANGKKKLNAKKTPKKKAVDCPIFLQSKFQNRRADSDPFLIFEMVNVSESSAMCAMERNPSVDEKELILLSV
jgi:hypothetical protein